MKERITTALDIISLLCHRQQKEMQNAMRDENFVNVIINDFLPCIIKLLSFKDSNVVSEVTVLLFHIVIECNIGKAQNKTQSNTDETKSDTDEAPIIAQKAVLALIEMCIGNYYNQEFALNGQVVVSINNILKKSNSTEVRN